MQNTVTALFCAALISGASTSSAIHAHCLVMSASLTVSCIYLRFARIPFFFLAKVTNLGARNSGLQDKLELFTGVDLRVMEESQFLKKKTDLLVRAIHWTRHVCFSKVVASNPLIIFLPLA